MGFWTILFSRINFFHGNWLIDFHGKSLSIDKVRGTIKLMIKITIKITNKIMCEDCNLEGRENIFDVLITWLSLCKCFYSLKKFG